MKLNKFAFLLFIFVPFICSAEILDSAVANQQAGEDEEAVEQFEKWLVQNLDHDRVPEVLSLYFKSITDLSRAKQVLADLQSACTNRKNSKSIILHRAFLEEISGNISEAQQLFEFANMRSTELSDVSNFFHSIRLLITMGELDRAEAQTMAIVSTSADNSLVFRGKLFLAYIKQLQGKIKEGTTLLDNAAKYTEKMSLQDAYLFYNLSQIYTNERYSEKALKILSSVYPDSIEYAEIKNGNVVIEPSLHYFESYYTAAPEGDASEEYAQKEHNSVRIQTGIFSKQDNAQTLVSALEKEGFTAEAIRIEREDSVLFRVVSPPMPTADSQEYILQLKEKGFEGFLLFR